MIKKKYVEASLIAENETTNEHIIMQVKSTIIQKHLCLIEINLKHQAIIMIVVLQLDIFIVRRLQNVIEMNDAQS
jgi:hypothetical protein